MILLYMIYWKKHKTKKKFKKNIKKNLKNKKRAKYLGPPPL